MGRSRHLPYRVYTSHSNSITSSFYSSPEDKVLLFSVGSVIFKRERSAPASAGVAPLVERCLVHQKVTGWIPLWAPFLPQYHRSPSTFDSSTGLTPKRHSSSFLASITSKLPSLPFPSPVLTGHPAPVPGGTRYWAHTATTPRSKFLTYVYCPGNFFNGKPGKDRGLPSKFKVYLWRGGWLIQISATVKLTLLRTDFNYRPDSTRNGTKAKRNMHKSMVIPCHNYDTIF